MPLNRGPRTSAYTLFMAWKSFMLFRKTVTLVTWWTELPASASTVLRLVRAWRWFADSVRFGEQARAADGEFDTCQGCGSGTARSVPPHRLLLDVATGERIVGQHRDLPGAEDEPAPDDRMGWDGDSSATCLSLSTSR